MLCTAHSNTQLIINYEMPPPYSNEDELARSR